MRRLSVLIVLLGVMLGVNLLKAESNRLVDSMTLAAIGFVLLAAFTFAEIGSAICLPRVTGYILAGTLLGPSVADILSRSVVDEMRMFNTLALGLIALAAGLELDARQIARLWRTLAATILVKVILGLALVGTALYTWELLLGTLSITAKPLLLALALIFGALSIGTSPAIALAVTSELRSKGRMTDLVLGAAVLKDLVVVVTLAVSVTLAQALVGASASTRNHVIAELSREIGYSLGTGAALGGLLVLYLRYVRAEMLLFVAAMILVVAEISRALHLELLLVFITAGFIVRNLSRFGHDLAKPVQIVALPVFVVFFTNAGAGIDLSRTFRVLPLALVLAGTRAVVYYVASRIGGRVGAESAPVQRGAWLAYLPQAGVTLGLVGLAASKVPSLADAISTLGMAVVAVNLLIGPITLRLALRRAGDLPTATVPSETIRESASLSALEIDHPEDRLEIVIGEVEDQRISSLAQRIAEDLGGINRELIDTQLAPWVRSLSQETAQVLDLSIVEPHEVLAVWSTAAPAVLAADRRDHANELFRRARRLLRQLPETRTLPCLGRHAEPAVGDGIALRTQKRWLRLRLLFGRTPSRNVPVAAAARVAIEGMLMRSYVEVVRRCNLAEVQALADLQAVALGRLDRREATKLIRDRLDSFLELARCDMERALLIGVREFIRLMQDAGSPSLPLSSVRYSVTEAEVRLLLAELDKESLAWTRGLEGARNALQLAAILGGTRESTFSVLGQSVVNPLDESIRSSAELVCDVEARLRALQQRLLSEARDSSSDAKALRGTLQQIFGDDVWEHLERDAAHFRRNVSTHRVALQIRRAIDKLPLRIKVTDARVLATEGKPTTAAQVELASTALWQETLLKGLLPSIDEEVRHSALILLSLAQRLRESEEIAVYALEQLDGVATAEAYTLAGEALGRASLRLHELASTLTEARLSTSTGIHQRVNAAFDSLSVALLEPTKSRERIARRALVQRIHDSARRSRELLARWRDGLSATLRRVGHSEVSRELISRYRKVHLDAVNLHEHVVRATTITAVPAPYARLFSLEPLVGPRLFVAYRRQLKALVEAERAWLEGKASSALVVGDHGSGRSSLLNQCKLELSAPRVIRPEPLQWRGELGLITALGGVLGVESDLNAITRALGSAKTTVLVDDLEQWISPDLAGSAELERFLELVVRTASTAFWIVTIESGTYALFQELTPMAHAFGLFIRLEPLKVDELRLVIEERHRISGRLLHHASAPLSAIRNRLPGLTDRDVTWRVLHGLSDGNPARALSLWSRSVILLPGDSIEIAAQRLLKAALPFVGWLHPRDQALLAQLTRFGPMRQSRLARLLGFGRADVVRRLAFLRAAGMIEGGQVEQDPARIPLELRPTVLQGLRFFQVKS